MLAEEEKQILSLLETHYPKSECLFESVFDETKDHFLPPPPPPPPPPLLPSHSPSPCFVCRASFLQCISSLQFFCPSCRFEFLIGPGQESTLPTLLPLVVRVEMDHR